MSEVGAIEIPVPTWRDRPIENPSGYAEAALNQGFDKGVEWARENARFRSGAQPTEIAVPAETLNLAMTYLKLQREQAAMVRRNPLFEPGASTMVKECDAVIQILRSRGVE